MINKFEFSPEADSIKGKFYNKEISLYVEGEDDKLFWDKLFKIAKIDAFIEEVCEGENQIKKKLI